MTNQICHQNKIEVLSPHLTQVRRKHYATQLRNNWSTIAIFFDPSWVQAIAHQSGFVQRTPKLNGPIFLQAMVFTSIEQDQATLKQFAQSCLDLGIEISEQGFDNRLGSESVAFLEEMFRQAMEQFRNKLPLPLPILHQFSHIYILDSSSIALPESLADEYPGSGGNAVCPGTVRTQIWEAIIDSRAMRQGIPREECWNERIEQIPLKRPETPEDIANVALFLSSEVARNITGEAINVNGGLRMD